MQNQPFFDNTAYPSYLDLPYVPVWPGQSRNFRSCPGQLSESPGFSWSQLVALVTNYGTTLVEAEVQLLKNIESSG